jgi:hypothetical protein
MTTGIGIGNGLGLISGAGGAGGGGDLVNTHSLEVGDFKFLNTGYSGITNAGVSMTVSCWFKVPPAITSQIIISTVPLDPGDFGRARLSLINTSVFAEFEVSDGTLKRDQVWTSPNAYRDDQWHQVVWQVDGYTYDTADWTLWVDGVNVSVYLRNDLTSATPWSVDVGASCAYGSTGVLAGAKFAQLAYFDYSLSGLTLWNGGTVFDLNSLPTGPVEWYQYAENIDNSGSSGVDGTPSAGTASYSTDVPPE